MYCKYKKKGEGDWTDAILECVQDSEILQRALFNELLIYNDFKYAAFLYKKLSCSLKTLPPRLVSYIETESTSTASFEAESQSSDFDIPEEVDINWEECTNTSVLTRPPSPAVINSTLALPTNVQIYDISSRDALISCQKVFSQVPVIGLDSEWRTVIDPSKAISVSILQLACFDKVFLLDIPAIVSAVSSSELESFVDEVFKDQIVVGYALDQDIKNLIESIPILGYHLSEYQQIMDLSDVHRYITISERERRARDIRAALGKGLPVPDSENTSQLTGLARLCELKFHAFLDKSCQLSNWNRRPLSLEQRAYAALDAYILLPLYYKLKEEYKSLHNLKSDTDIPAINREINSMSYAAMAQNSIPANTLKLVVDIPLQGLGKKLRHIGVDTAILNNDQSVDDAVRISLSDGRVVLSKDSNCDRIARHLDPGRVYRVSSHNASDQLAEIISHFKLTISDHDFFSRCAVCNCAIFAKLSCDLVKRIFMYQPNEAVSAEVTTVELHKHRSKYVGDLDVNDSGRTNLGVRFQIDQLKPKRFDDISEFWGCTECGKMYWDGCHMKNFREKHGI